MLGSTLHSAPAETENGEDSAVEMKLQSDHCLPSLTQLNCAPWAAVLT